jgi:alpha-N-acetylglucosaminidase
MHAEIVLLPSWGDSAFRRNLMLSLPPKGGTTYSTEPDVNSDRDRNQLAMDWSANHDEMLVAVAGLIARVFPRHRDAFVLEWIAPSDDGYDVFDVQGVEGKVVIRGNSGVSLSSGVGWYLETCCHCHVSLCGNQLDIPETLPPAPAECVRHESRLTCRTFFNYCTFNYTMSWWGWDEWERMIDFMALKGINMPLAITGLEAVWYHTLLTFGFDDEEAREFLCGPAYLAWQWMTNMEGVCGPLPKRWIEQQQLLGRRIIERERSFGMNPIQQGFSGYVPRQLAEKRPNARIVIGNDWFGLPGTAQLDPLDPLFKKFGARFLEEQTKLYGTNHVYATDPFHEGTPPVEGDAYLQNVGRAIMDLLLDVDPQAVWVMQAWSIRKPIACAAPKDRLLILDLAGGRHKKLDDFWGYPFTEGRLNNFGDRTVLHGDLDKLAINEFETTRKECGNLAGLGLFMEGMRNNPVYVDLFLKMIWQQDSVDVASYLSGYAHRRYGAQSDAAQQAWQILHETVYQPGFDGIEPSSALAARPALDLTKSGPNRGFHIPYANERLAEAWELLLQDASLLSGSDGYRFDVMDVGRQVLANYAFKLARQWSAHFKRGDADAFETTVAAFLGVLDDVDALLMSREEYNLGKWMHDAESKATTDEERSFYRHNALSLLTLWGGEKPTFFDYAWRDWGGLIKHYYRPRWVFFFDHLRGKLATGESYADPVDEEQLAFGIPRLRATLFYDKLADWELGWSHSDHDIPHVPQGDTIEIAQGLLSKYRSQLAEPMPAYYEHGPRSGKDLESGL